jgi:transcriptional regulator with XRE-family HTH domain
VNNIRDTQVLKKLGDNLKAIRTSKGFTLEQLAYAADIELSQIHRIEKGKINPTITTLTAIARGLEIPVSDLVHNLT